MNRYDTHRGPREFLIIDDHPMIASAMGGVIESIARGCRVHHANDLAEALRVLRRSPGVELVLLDLNLPDCEPLTGLEALVDQRPRMRVIIVSAEANAATVRRCTAAGAQGFIPKTLGGAEVRQALERVLAGQTYLPEMSDPPATSDDTAPADAPQAILTPRRAPESGQGIRPEVLGLTHRQTDVLRLIVRGWPNKRISTELGLSEGTVKTHVSSIFRLLGVHTRTQAVLSVNRLRMDLGRAA